tara:strand:+ start:1474 stop:1602 length:129 start_codon:yes stop_codon:yes gene_type:complete
MEMPVTARVAFFRSIGITFSENWRKEIRRPDEPDRGGNVFNS